MRHFHERESDAIMRHLPLLRRIAAALFLGLTVSLTAELRAETPTSQPTLEQRVAGLEAYLANQNPADANAAPASLALGRTAGPGHNAWMMTSAMLVLFMTLPGLALFYGGLVRTKNVLSIMAWCLGISSLVTILWWAVGYSLVFGKNFHSAFVGGSEYFFFRGVESAPNADYSYWVSHNVFAIYQLMFAIITPAVIIGAVVERMKFSAVLLFVTCWMMAVYCPLAHMVWGATGWMNGVWNAHASVHAIDFAGGLVVEMASGFSALMLCLILGPRRGFGQTPMPPHSMVLCMAGAGLLWVGWYGFNAGSAVGADAIAANAFTTTTLTAAVAAGVWGLLEYFWRGKASVLGLCSGAVAGLVAVTPACGFISPISAVVLGVLGAVIPFFACTKVKATFGYDDALDVFGVHGAAGTVGTLFTGFCATAAVNANLGANLQAYVGHSLWLEQLKAMGVTVLLVGSGTAVIAYAIKFTVGLRPTPEAEMEGLDQTDHGEHGYIYDSSSI
jgi:Amt family ammonium transporter